ncbi:hypothetical protein AOQ73_26780 [Bradyrhizobium pachyrhizi]|uniref:hypothetical protein n=1 Tax=Bradyrhizobium pachyrhizi TaxID=280333 RepID=UPI000704E70C|nr:hypothetical protein [Bradyrhizobium pachyrhizi]KRP89229.1 hypothetical protein AOQ73_26780 [Bradyrhizobium pachyrhizi]
MNFDITNIANLVGGLYVHRARQAFGDEGAEAIRDLTDSVRSIFQRSPPESLEGTLTVVRGIACTPLAPVIATFGMVKKVADLAALGTELANADRGPHAFVEICSDGSFRHLVLQELADLSVLAASALVYHYDSGLDRILGKNFDVIVPKVSSLMRSNFATPTLSGLEDALARYGREMALETQCQILAGVWEGGVDGARLILTNRPEATMRNSLVQALSLLTRDASVRPEQNTDETKPVDIRVEWFGSGASALIEIKWLGKSSAKSRTPGSSPTYTEYAAPRAQEGADQLADYMDRQSRHSGATAPRGYLVVFDARRRNVAGAQDRLKRDDALYYSDKEIEYDPDHTKLRTDYAEPFRFFMNPRASYFIAA